MSNVATKSANNGQPKTQTVHVPFPTDVLREVRALAQLEDRTLVAQVIWLTKRGLQSLTSRKA